jgi:hypothetical protein
MNEPPAILRILPFVFPLVFIGFWLLITTILAFVSGWFGLQQWYADDGDEEPLLRLRGQTGFMGGVRLNGALTLAATRRGLSIRVSRIFAPFQKPLLIPWSEIDAIEQKRWFSTMIRLDLGKPANGKLTI